MYSHLITEFENVKLSTAVNDSDLASLGVGENDVLIAIPSIVCIEEPTLKRQSIPTEDRFQQTVLQLDSIVVWKRDNPEQGQYVKVVLLFHYFK